MGNKIAATPLAKTLAREKGVELAAVHGSGTGGVIKGRDIESFRRAKATPLAARIAREMKLELTGIQGSGYGGKIRKEDVMPLLENNRTEAVMTSGGERVPMKGIRRIIADRMLKSHLEAPPVTLDMKADVTELLNLRKQLNKLRSSRITINDFVIKAAAISLREHPFINVKLEKDSIVFMDCINIGMAVALPQGLIVPVIKNAGSLGLEELSAAAKDLGTRAREDRLMPDEITGGTFTVSNLGMYGITSFTPIINPPESAILGVCAVEEVLRLRDGMVESRSIMGLSLTIDHRVIDGAQGAVFLGRIKELLENPLEIMIERRQEG